MAHRHDEDEDYAPPTPVHVDSVVSGMCPACHRPLKRHSAIELLRCAGQGYDDEQDEQEVTARDRAATTATTLEEWRETQPPAVEPQAPVEPAVDAAVVPVAGPVAPLPPVSREQGRGPMLTKSRREVIMLAHQAGGEITDERGALGLALATALGSQPGAVSSLLKGLEADGALVRDKVNPKTGQEQLRSLFKIVLNYGSELVRRVVGDVPQPTPVSTETDEPQAEPELEPSVARKQSPVVLPASAVVDYEELAAAMRKVIERERDEIIRNGGPLEKQNAELKERLANMLDEASRWRERARTNAERANTYRAQLDEQIKTNRQLRNDMNILKKGGRPKVVDLKEIIRVVESTPGWEVRVLGNGHYGMYKDGVWVTDAASSGQGNKVDMATRVKLKKAGVSV